MSFQLEKDEVVLTTSKAQRSDAGKYKLQLKNPSGVGEGTFNVNVLGRDWDFVFFEDLLKY